MLIYPNVIYPKNELISMSVQTPNAIDNIT